MLLGFYDRHGNGLAVELTPEMAKAIANCVRGIFAVTVGGGWDVSEVRLARWAFEDVYRLNRYIKVRSSEDDDFFVLTSDTELFRSEYDSTGAWIDVENDEPMVFWEVYDSSNRQNTPYLSLSQLDAIANNQPLPQE